jgi:ATP-binding cassette subfamily F protein uup
MHSRQLPHHRRSHDRDFRDRVVTSIVASEGYGSWIEYAGGYTDMLAQRGAAPHIVSPAKPGRVKQPRPPVQDGRSSAATQRGLNFNDRRALDVLPARIAALETQIAELNAVLADLDLYARDPAKFGATTEALAAARDELTAVEEQWLRLELLREEIEMAAPRH